MAAGSGAAAVAHINGGDNGDAPAELETGNKASELIPVPPSSPNPGRPKGSAGSTGTDEVRVSDHGSDVMVKMWLEILQGIETKGTTKKVAKEDWPKCASLAARFQGALEEVVASCLSAGLVEEHVRSALKDNMFKSAPNPQDPASSKDPSSSSTKTAGRQEAHHAQPSCNPMPCCAAKAKEEPEAKEKKGLMICKHYDGDPNQTYDLGHQVGEGTFGSVRKARHRQTGQIHAVKQVPKRLIQGDELWSEIGIMKQLDHPHIMRLYYTFEDELYVYMASEMCAGGELYDTLDETGFFPERVAAVLMRQILGAVNYLHSSKHIAHRDLKPENFLVLKRVEHEMLHLKLIDFGTAKRFDLGGLKTKVCTAHYVAPEVLKRGDVEYTEKVDVWSCGVILYMLLCGFMPFHHDDDREILKIVKKGKYSFSPSAVWGLISDLAKDLITKMMCVKVDQRCTATQAFEHDWVQSQEPGGDCDLLPSEDIVKSMRQFLTNNRLKRVALQIIARQISDDGITKLRNIFTKIDSDHSGTLTIQEMDDALVMLEMGESSRAEMAAIMRSIDVEGSGELEYTEFLAAMLTQEQYLKEDICKGAFHLLDVDGDGTLSTPDLQSLLSNSEDSSLKMSKAAIEEIAQIMNEVDEDGDGGVSFEEFWSLMKEEGPKVNNTAVSLRWQRGKKEGHLNVDGLELEEDEEGVEGEASKAAAAPEGE